ncbi:MAG: hypothetical protein U0Q11_05620 [Vicinamibacterales bacterium]
MAQPTAWIEKTVRSNPRGEDTQALLPALAEQVESVEQERTPPCWRLTLHFHTDKTDPADSGQEPEAGGREGSRCSHARPGVIVLGDVQGTFLQVCIAKKACEKHWGAQPASSEPTPDQAEQAAEARRQQEETWARQRAEQSGGAASVLALPGSSPSGREAAVVADARLLLADIRPDDLFLDVFGKPDCIAAKHYLQGAGRRAGPAALLAAAGPAHVQQAARREGDVQGPRRHASYITCRWRGAQRADQTAEDADARRALRPRIRTPLTDSSVGGARRGSHRLVQTTSQPSRRGLSGSPRRRQGSSLRSDRPRWRAAAR